VHYTLCDFILDVFQNGVEAGGTELSVAIREEDSEVAVTVTDNGTGMDEREKRRALDPFYTAGGKHPERRVGLGLPFLAACAEQVGGSLDIDTAPGIGTTVQFSLPTACIDTPPLGDVAGTIRAMMCYDRRYEVVVERSCGGRCYVVRRTDLTEALGELESAGSQALLRDYLEQNERELHGTED